MSRRITIVLNDTTVAQLEAIQKRYNLLSTTQAIAFAVAGVTYELNRSTSRSTTD